MKSPRVLIVVVTLTVLAAIGVGCSGPSGAGTTPASGAVGSGGTHYPMTITQPDGSTAVIKAPPTRIVTVGNPSISMDNVVALGVKPIGGEILPGDGYDARGVPKEIAGEITSFTAVGTAPAKPDLEKIVSLHPDLIVGVNGKSTGNLKQLEAIAPVESPTGSMPPAGTGVESLESVQQVRLLGKILNRKAAADAFVTKLDQAAATVRAAVKGKTVNLVTPSADGSTFFWFGADAQPTGHFLTFAGLDLPTTFPGGGRKVVTGDYTYSTERAGQLTAQYLVLGIRPNAFDGFLANPLVAQLPSVKAGRVIRTQGTSEGFGEGSLIAGAVGQLKALPGIQKAFTTTGTPPS